MITIAISFAKGTLFLFFDPSYVLRGSETLTARKIETPEHEGMYDLLSTVTLSVVFLSFKPLERTLKN